MCRWDQAATAYICKHNQPTSTAAYICKQLLYHPTCSSYIRLVAAGIEQDVQKSCCKKTLLCTRNVRQKAIAIM
jgi:hypothetical protein